MQADNHRQHSGKRAALRALLLQAGLLVISTPLYAQLMFHADKSMQLGCKVQIHGQEFNLSSYLLPDKENRVDVMGKPACNSLPGTGRVLLTIDLTSQEQRKVPIGITIVSVPATAETPRTVVLEVPPKHYLQGVISHEAQIDTP